MLGKMKERCQQHDRHPPASRAKQNNTQQKTPNNNTTAKVKKNTRELPKKEKHKQRQSQNKSSNIRRRETSLDDFLPLHHPVASLAFCFGQLVGGASAIAIFNGRRFNYRTKIFDSNCLAFPPQKPTRITNPFSVTSSVEYSFIKT